MGLRLALRELRLLKGLDHPLVIKLRRAFFSRNCRLYAVFPYIDGGCAQSVLKARYPRGLPPILLKSFAWQLCLAVRYLHQQKVLHRDIKPANVLLSSDGTLRLCDFGFARRVTDLGSAVQPTVVRPSSSTAAAAEDPLTPYVQTRPYRAPEVLLGQPYGAAADIWALGATVAEMATGEVLLPGSSSLDQLWRILAVLPGPRPPALDRAVDTLQRLDPALVGDAVPPELLRPQHPPGLPLTERLAAAPGGGGGGLEPGLVAFVTACLQLDPAARPSAEQLLRMPWLTADGDIARLAAGNPVLERLRAEFEADAVAASQPPVRSHCSHVWGAAAGGGNGGGCKEHACSEAVEPPPPGLLLRNHQAATTAAAAATHGSTRREASAAMVFNASRRAAAAAPGHRRSLSAGNRAEALTMAAAPPPVDLQAAMAAATAAAAAAACKRPAPRGRLLAAWAPENWRLRAAVAAAAATPAVPPPPQTPPPPPARRREAPPTPPAQAAAAAPAVAVPPRRAEPAPLLQRPQRPSGDGALPLRMAASLDAAMLGGWGPVRGAADTGAAAAASRPGLSHPLPHAGGAVMPLLRPKYKPGRVRQLPPPPPLAPAPQPAVTAAGKMNRNASAPDLTQMAHDESVHDGDGGDALASESMAAAVTAGGAAAATRRGAWSQLGCRTGTGTAEGAPPQRDGGRPAGAQRGDGGEGPAHAGAGADTHPTTAAAAMQAAAALCEPYDDDDEDDDLLPRRRQPPPPAPAPRTGLKMRWPPQPSCAGAGAEVDVADADVFADCGSPSLTFPPVQPVAAGVPPPCGYDTPFATAAAAAPLSPDATIAAWDAIIARAVAGGGRDPGGAHAHGGGAGGGGGTATGRWRPTCLGYVSDAGRTSRPAPTAPLPLPEQSDVQGPRHGFASPAGGASSVLYDGNSSPQAPSVSGPGFAKPLGEPCVSWPPPVLAAAVGARGRSGGVATVYGMGSGDDAPLPCGRSYGTRKSTVYDSEDGWLEELGSWQECGGGGGGKFMAAAAGRGGGGRGLLLSSPTLTKLGVVEDETPHGGSRSGSFGSGRRGRFVLGFTCGLRRAARRLACFGGGAGDQRGPGTAYDE